MYISRFSLIFSKLGICTASIGAREQIKKLKKFSGPKWAHSKPNSPQKGLNSWIDYWRSQHFLGVFPDKNVELDLKELGNRKKSFCTR